MPDSGDELTETALRRTLQGSRCPRCGKIPLDAHDGPRLGFCPAFSRPGESGHWLTLGGILRAVNLRLRRHSRGIFRVDFDRPSRIEEHWGNSEGGNFGLNRSRWHLTLGSRWTGERDQRDPDLPLWTGRTDHPHVPEFSIYYPDRGRHTVVYRGWRYRLPSLCDTLRIPWPRLAADLGVSPDRTTESIRRFEVGWL